MENNNIVENGSMTQMNNVEPTFGGELLPVNQVNNDIKQPSNLEMAASIGLVMAVGYGVGKLGELLFDKVIGPNCKKIGEKFDDKMAKKKARKSKDKLETDVIEGEFSQIDNEDETDESQEEQSIPKKGMKAVDGLRKEKRKR